MTEQLPDGMRYRKGRYEWDVYVGWVVDENTGKRKKKRRSGTHRAPEGRAGLREAVKRRAADVAWVDENRDDLLHPGPTDGTATVADLLERWYEVRLSSWSPTSATTTRVTIDRYLVPHVGGLRVDQVRGHHLDRLYATLAEGGGRGGRPLAASTVRRVHTTIGAAFRQAVRWRLVDRNPIDEASPPKSEPTSVSAPDPTELGRSLEATRDRNSMLYLYLVLAANTGCRRGEIMGLQWGDIDADEATVTIRRGVVASGGSTVVKGTKTGRVRTVALTGSVVALLERWRRRQQTEALAQGAGRLRPSGWVFAFDHTTDSPPRPDWATRAWTRLRADLGLDHVRLHDLRHFAATQLLGAGVDVGTVADRLGHSRASTTLDLYRHHLPQRDREAADILDDIIDAGGASS